METLFQDVRYGIRTLLRSPGFTAAAVLSLALGIGANTAIFTMIDAVLLKMLPVKEPESLVALAFASPEYPNVPATSFSYPMFRDLRDRNQVFSSMVAYCSLPVSLNADGHTERVSGQLASGNIFSALGVNPLLGRAFSDEDDRKPGAHPVAVLSYNFWKRRLGGDPGLVGKIIHLNGYPFTAIGVAPPDFFGLEVGVSPDLWVPMMMHAQMEPRREVMPGLSLLSDPGNRWLRIMARLKPGLSEPQARAASELLFQQLNREHVDLIFQQGLKLFQELSQNREQKLPELPPREVFERSLQDHRIRVQQQRIQLLPGSKGLSELRQQFSEPLLILMAVVALVLIIACGNVANLLLARSAARQREMAVRLALGAGRLRLIRQLLTESTLLSLLGGSLGTILAFWGIDVVASFLPASLTSIALDLSPDHRVLGFTLAMSLLTGLLFGLAPAFQSTRPNLVPALKNEVSVPERGFRRLGLRQILVVFQVALSLLLLIGGGLFVRTLENLKNQDLGFNTQKLLLLSMDPSLNGYRKDQVGTFYAELLHRVETLPGVQSASLASAGLSGGGTDFSVEGYQPGPEEVMDIAINYVEPRFFETMGITLRIGRDFGRQDNRSASKVVIVNERVAHQFFGRQNPIGKRIGLGSRHRAPDLEIVGVVRDARYFDLRQQAALMAYLPFQSYFGSERNLASRTVLVRATGDPKSLIAAVRREVQVLDKDLPIYNVMTFTEQIGELLAQERLIAALSSFFALLALLLACVGLYGIMSYTVVRRTNEIGIRMALGAQQDDVLWLVLRETLVLVLIGVAVGLAASVGATRLISSLLFGLRPTDPLTIAVATLTLISVAALAGYLPARRASKVDPLVALRYE